MIKYSHTEYAEEEILIADLTGETAHLVLHNDDINTFDFVIDCLVKICRHQPEQAEQCALLVHYKGKATVKTSDPQTLQPMKQALLDRGLSATIETIKE